MSRIPTFIRRVIGLPSCSITASESGEFGLFGTSKLPPRNLDSRNAAASFGRILFISIAVFCAVILAVLLTRIYGEAFVPENEIEISDTQLQWKASTWDPNWPLDDPRRDERNNITLEATWTIATYGGMGLDGSLLVDVNGDPVISDLMDTMRTNLCLSGLASSTYLPIEAWSVGSIFGAERQELAPRQQGAVGCVFRRHDGCSITPCRSVPRPRFGAWSRMRCAPTARTCDVGADRVRDRIL